MKIIIDFDEHEKNIIDQYLNGEGGLSMGIIDKVIRAIEKSVRKEKRINMRNERISDGISAEDIGYQKYTIKTLKEVYDIADDGVIVWVYAKGDSCYKKESFFSAGISYDRNSSIDVHSGYINGGSFDAIIYGIMAALDFTPKGKRIYIVTSAACGFKNYFKGRGAKYELVKKMIMKIKDHNKFITEIYWPGAPGIIQSIVNSN